MPITEVREWNDLGFNELIGAYTDPQPGGVSHIMGFR